jgi:hypothetical protein
LPSLLFQCMILTGPTTHVLMPTVRPQFYE